LILVDVIVKGYDGTIPADSLDINLVDIPYVTHDIFSNYTICTINDSITRFVFGVIASYYNSTTFDIEIKKHEYANKVIRKTFIEGNKYTLYCSLDTIYWGSFWRGISKDISSFVTSDVIISNDEFEYSDSDLKVKMVA